jgi:membrane protein implicated in regulation of membrane protease activity
MNAIVVWFIIGAVLMVAELFTPSFIIVFFGVGAWAAALVAAIAPGLEQELAAFLVVSLASLLLLRKRLVNTFQGKEALARQNAPEFPHINRQADVTQAIPAGGEGEISLGGSFWRATSAVAIEKGGQVRVLAPEPDNELLLRVEPWDKGQAGS